MSLVRNAIDALMLRQAPASGRLPAVSAVLRGPLTEARSTSQHTTDITALNASSWLFITVDRIASAVAAAEWRLYEKRRGERRVIDQHEVLDLWAKWNPYHTGLEEQELLIQYFLLVGEMWISKVRDGKGRPIELWAVRPDHMAPVPHPTEYISGYIYSLAGERVPIDRNDIIYTRRPNPLDRYRGISVIRSLITDLASDREAALWSREFFRNSAEPGGVIELAQNMDDDAFQEWKQRWREMHQGTRAAHRVAVLEGGMKWVERKITQRDMQFAQLRMTVRDEVLGAMGMPRSIVGITEDVNRANAEAAAVVFAEWLLIPILRRLRAALNSYLLPDFGPNLELDFLDPRPTNRKEQAEIATSAFEKMLITRNEGRALMGLGEADVDGDSYFTPPLQFSARPESTRLKVLPGDNPLYSQSIREQFKVLRRGWEQRFSRELIALSRYIDDLDKGRWNGAGHPGKTLGFGAWYKLEPTDFAAYDWDWWSKYEDEVVAELAAAFEAAALTEAGSTAIPGLQQLAAQWAKERGAQLLRLDGDVNVVAFTRERVNTLVAQTLERGESLQTLKRNLASDIAFSPVRAERVARTETAVALGQGRLEAAKQEGAREKHWWSNESDIDPEVCEANEAQGWIPITDPFQSGDDTIPAHPACECNVTYRQGGKIYRSMGDSAVVSRIPVAACPDCGKKPLGRDVVPGSRLYCKACREEKVVVC